MDIQESAFKFGKACIARERLDSCAEFVKYFKIQSDILSENEADLMKNKGGEI